MDNLWQYIHNWCFVSYCGVDDLVSFSDLVANVHFLSVDCDFTNCNSFRVVVSTERLELDLEDLNEFFIDPSSFGKGFKLMLVGFHEAKTMLQYVDSVISLLIFRVLLYCFLSLLFAVLFCLSVRSLAENFRFDHLRLSYDF